MRIELLSFEDCPNRDIAFERLRLALEMERLTVEVREILLDDPADAQALRFLGSPTVRIDGLDVEPSARSSERFGFMCRTYRSEHGVEGAPSLDIIRAALRIAKRAPS
jgi:hypothetical protein